jgi:DNA mismatch endonuclease (patch repair protein)
MRGGGHCLLFGMWEYWVPKLAGNRERDARKDAELESAGYRVFVVRDCDFKAKLEELARLVAVHDAEA